MSAWRVGVLMALGFLPRMRGHVQLPSPQNVTLLSKAFDMILTWCPGEGSPPGVTYTVRYESQERVNKWMKVPHCKHIQRTSCNLTCVIQNHFVKVRARVKAVSGPQQSPWVESQYKEYHLDVELAPPVLNLCVKENFIYVNASFPLASCVRSLSWMYDLNLWEAGSEDKKQYEGNFGKKTKILDVTALRGNYCLSARSSFQSIGFKYSQFSQPVCVLLNHKAVEWKFPFPAIISVFVLPIFLSSTFLTCFLKQEARRKKMPRALDVSHLKAAGPAFYLELSEKEFFRDYLICTEKPVSQRKTDKSLERNNQPWMDSFLSSSSSSEEEEEEEEGGGAFIPYIEMPQFPKRNLNCQPSRTAQGETSSHSGSGGLSVGSESVLDLSALGFSFLPKRKNEMDTSGSQGSEKTPLSQNLRRLSLTDVRMPGPREHGQHERDRGEYLEMTLLQTSTEGTWNRLVADEHCLYEKTPFSSQPVVDLQVQIREVTQLSGYLSEHQFISFQTLQVAEDEGTASSCDSDNWREGTPPTSTVLSDAFEASNMEEKYDQNFKFKGCECSHYMARS